MRRRVLLGAGLALLLGGAALMAWPVYHMAYPLSVPPGTQADRVVVERSGSTLTLLRGGEPLKTYKVAIGAEQREDPTALPDGLYRVSGRDRESDTYRALEISLAQPGRQAGAEATIHGTPAALAWLGPLHRLAGWEPEGIAVTTLEIEEIWRSVADGTPVEVRP